MTIPNAEKHIKRTIRVLHSFKDQPGEKLEEALKGREAGVFVTVPLKSNPKAFQIKRQQFIQSLEESMNQRLCCSSPKNAQFLEDMKILEISTWPSQPWIRHVEEQITNNTISQEIWNWWVRICQWNAWPCGCCNLQWEVNCLKSTANMLENNTMQFSGMWEGFQCDEFDFVRPSFKTSRRKYF